MGARRSRRIAAALPQACAVMHQGQNFCRTTAWMATNQRTEPRIKSAAATMISHAFRRWTGLERAPQENVVNSSAESTSTASRLTGTPKKYPQRDLRTVSQDEPGPQPTAVPPLNETERRYAEMPTAASSSSRIASAGPPRN